jgi:hypothetical protein
MGSGKLNLRGQAKVGAMRARARAVLRPRTPRLIFAAFGLCLMVEFFIWLALWNFDLVLTATPPGTAAEAA